MFPDYEVYIGQEPLLFSSPNYVAEIYKIHGCASVPSSLVLTTDDYKDFDSKNAYLAAKLLTVFVEHPIIFLGYSLTDTNITAILRAIARCLSPAALRKLEDRLIFVQRAAGKPVRVEPQLMKIDGDNIPLTVAYTDDFSDVFEPLTAIKRRFPARLLRQMKQHVYDLVLKNDPNKQLFVVDIEDAETFVNIDVVYGVGVSKNLGIQGYRPIQSTDLLKDVMEASSAYDAGRVVQETLKKMQGKYIPVFKYLRDAGELNDDGTLRNAEKHDSKVRELAAHESDDFLPPVQYRGKKEAIRANCGSVSAIVAKYGAEDAPLYIPLLRDNQIDRSELRDFILANMNLLSAPNSMVSTYFKSAICFYDFLVGKRRA